MDVSRVEYYELFLHSLQHAHNKLNITRHSSLIFKWCRDFSDKVYVSELAYIKTILVTLQGLYTKHPETFHDNVIEVFKFLSKPYLEKKTNELELYMQDLEALLSVVFEFYNITQVPQLEVKEEVILCLIVFTSDKAQNSINNDDCTNPSLSIKNQILRISALKSAKVLAKTVTNFANEIREIEDVLANVKTATNDQPDSDWNEVDDNALFKNLTQRYQIIVYRMQLWLKLYSNVCFDQDSIETLNSVGLCNYLVYLIHTFRTTRSNITSDAIYLLWTLLENHLLTTEFVEPVYRKDKEAQIYCLTQVIDFEHAIAVFTDALRNKLLVCSSLVEKEIRNNLVVLLSLPLKCPRFVKPTVVESFISNDTLQLLIKCATLPELQPDLANLDHCIQTNFCQSLDVDIQFKQLIWLLIAEILQSNNNATAKLVSESTVVQVLLQYLGKSCIEQVTAPGVRNNLNFNSKASVTNNDDPIIQITTKVGTCREKAWSRTNQLCNNLPYQTLTKLLSQVTAETPKSYYEGYSKSHLLLLQGSALNFLSICGHLLESAFVRQNGIQCTLNVINIVSICDSSDDDGFRAMIHNILSLHNSLAQSSILFKNILCECSAVSIYMNIIKRYDNAPLKALSMQLINQLCRDESCGSICRDQINDSEESGIQVLVGILHSYLHTNRAVSVGSRLGFELLSPNQRAKSIETILEETTKEYNHGTIPIILPAALNCIRSCLVCPTNQENMNLKLHKANLNELIRRNGIDITLDLLEVSPFVLRYQILRFMSDIVNDSVIRAIFLSWKSSISFRNLFHLLALCWMEEEKRLGIVTATNENNNSISFRQQNIFGVNLANLDAEPVLESEVRPEDSDNSDLDFVSVSSDENGHCSHHDLTARTDIAIPHNLENIAIPYNCYNKSVENNSSTLVSRLTRAVLESRFSSSKSKTEGIDVPCHIRDISLADTDIRAVIAYLFLALGAMERVEHKIASAKIELSYQTVSDRFHEITLSPQQLLPTNLLGLREQLVLSRVRHHIVCEVGAWYHEVLRSCITLGIEPIESDLNLITQNLDYAEKSIIMSQKDLLTCKNEMKRNEEIEEAAFYQSIVCQRDNEIKAMWLKKNAVLTKRTRFKKMLKATYSVTEDAYSNRDKDIKPNTPNHLLSVNLTSFQGNCKTVDEEPVSLYDDE